MKEIEIPFVPGGYNSETMGWEYVIPEGYTARIEGEKIIMKKEESEDERIRKEILDCFQSMKAQGCFPSRHKEQYTTWIAWLEKQKDITPIIVSNEDWDCQRAYSEGYQNGMAESNKQKPAEWKPLPESMEALLLAIEGKWDAIKPTGYMSRRLEDLYDGLVNTFDVDEKYLGNLPKTEYTEKDIEEIKALKEKIDSSMETKPAEWSEENEKDMAHIIRILDNCYAYGKHDLSKTDHENLVNKLKSLRPQPHWKPSGSVR